MIKRHSDIVLEITAHDPDTVENDLNTAVEIAREHAMKECRHGILVTQHGYTSYTVAVSRDVPYGQTYERRQQSADSRRRPAWAARVRHKPCHESPQAGS